MGAALIDISGATGDAHDVANPAQFNVLLLQKIVVGKFGVLFTGYTCKRPVELDT